jgi:hypothetical protein
MKVLAPAEVEHLVREQGGRLYVWVERQRSCQAATYLLTSNPPERGRTLRRVEGPAGVVPTLGR